MCDIDKRNVRRGFCVEWLMFGNGRVQGLGDMEKGFGIGSRNRVFRKRGKIFHFEFSL